MCEFKVLLGKTLVSATGNVGDNEVVFIDTAGVTYKLCHWQDCCEDVSVEDINGDLNDLVGSPILQAEELSNSDLQDGKPIDSKFFTWTFYRIATQKGGVVIRWLGESNGYYSESVNFEIVQKETK